MNEYVKVYRGSLTRDLCEEIEYELSTHNSPLFVSKLPFEATRHFVQQELARRLGEYTTALYAKPNYQPEHNYGQTFCAPSYTVSDQRFWAERRTYSHHAPLTQYMGIPTDYMTVQLLWNIGKTDIDVCIQGTTHLPLSTGDVVLFPISWTHPYHIIEDNAAVLIAIALA